MPLLEVRELTRRFGGVAAVDSVSFEVEAGEVFGLIGPNGAGKTTLLNLISGLLPASHGEVVFAGERLTGRRPAEIAARGVARTFQIVKPFGGMTVRENVSAGALFGRRSHRRTTHEALELADQVLERVGLAHRRLVEPAALPLAERKRLELARALAMEPSLLLLDEVMAGLNPAEVDRMVEVVRGVSQGGVTVIMIEHVMKAVMAVSRRVMVLYYGRRLALGTPQDVVRDPEVIRAYLGHRYAAATAARD